jgi:hypothetical protein
VRKAVAVVAGLLMVAAGCLWTLQGLGYVEGSAMTGRAVWAIVGPLVAGFGVALLFVAFQRRS